MNSIPQAKPTARALGTAPVCPLSCATLGELQVSPPGGGGSRGGGGVLAWQTPLLHQHIFSGPLAKSHHAPELM